MSSEAPAGIPVVLSGPSGVGKTTIQKQLLARYQDVVPSISATTRSPRPGEVNGKDYLFLSMDDFKKGIEEEWFLEYAEVHGQFYGTPRGPLEEHLHKGVDGLLVIDVQGGLQVRSRCEESLLIFLLPPSMEDLERRIRGRGDVSGEDMAVRLRNAQWEMSFAKDYDYWVVNRSLEEAVAQVRAILVADRCRPTRIRRRFEKLQIALPGVSP
jgi:guanylate kinase